MAKLLVIVSYKVFPPQMGGQKGIVHFYGNLSQHHEIIMVGSSDNEAETPGYRIENMLYNNHRMAFNLLRLRWLKNLIEKENIDAIIAEHSYTGWIAWLLKRLTGKPFIIHSHNIEASRFRQMGKSYWKAYLRYERWIHQKADFSFFKTREEKDYAVNKFSLPTDKCSVIPYGVSNVAIIPAAEQKLRELYHIETQFIFYFNGTLDYTPNRQAVERIVSAIDPALTKARIDYTILISGKNLCDDLQQQIKKSANILYLDYVEDVHLLYQASTLFLNAVTNDSGIKTKLVEALANGCKVVSTQSGATGIPKDLYGQKLIITPDGDWEAFVTAMLENLSKTASQLPSYFFSYFSWPEIAQKAAGRIQATIKHA